MIYGHFTHKERKVCDITELTSKYLAKALLTCATGKDVVLYADTELWDFINDNCTYMHDKCKIIRK